MASAVDKTPTMDRLLEVFRSSRASGTWCKLTMETCNGQEFLTLAIQKPADFSAGTAVRAGKKTKIRRERRKRKKVKEKEAEEKARRLKESGQIVPATLVASSQSSQVSAVSCPDLGTQQNQVEQPELELEKPPESGWGSAVASTDQDTGNQSQSQVDGCILNYTPDELVDALRSGFARCISESINQSFQELNRTLDIKTEE